MAKEKYSHAEIEKRAQVAWAAAELHTTDLTNTEKDPYYLLFEFPYPSGDLHIGHWYAFALCDVYARMLRQQGKNVFFPIGFDAFGLPTENAAIKNSVDPREWTLKNIERMRGQVRSMGTTVDWSREVISSEPEYYRWTQWLFAKLFEQGLAERRLAPVKWCPKDQTVLAHEQVLDGKCERCGTEVEEKHLTQWFLKITKYAKRLLEDLEPLPWREEIKDAQRAWIGESKGAKLSFAISGREESIEVFTTRPDTLFGATYVVLAPEHELVATLLDIVTNKDAVLAYRKQTAQKSERERSENKQKSGVQLEGVMAVNPATKEQIPVYIADYVLATYGTGAVMAVPAHDERDFEFAKLMNLPIKHVVMPTRIDHRNPHQEGKELTHRSIVIAIVHDPRTDTYLTLRWKQQPWVTFVTGGVEENEDVVEAAKREIAEETGYTDVTFKRVLGGPTQSEFYAAHKGVNRYNHATTILFELGSDAQEALSEEENALHELVWRTRTQIESDGLQHAEMDIILGRLFGTESAMTEDGVLVNSGEFSGRDNREALEEIVAFAGGEMVTNYRIRDWLVSRQRYWGCPIPIVYDPEGVAHPVPPEHLPWLLPTDVTSGTRADGQSPLAGSEELRERVVRIFGEGWTPEYDTLDVFVDSSWYFTRYLAPNSETAFSDPALMKKWLPVNRYSGGAEHTTVHLLYSRFFYKALYDLALVPTAEPYVERYNRGLILGPDGQKMSKRWGNVVNPDEMVEKFGADAVRMYLAFIGPYNEPGNYPWKLDGVQGTRKFLDRVYHLREKVGETEVSKELTSALVKATNKVTEDTERFKMNTAVAALMVLVREMEALPVVPRTAFKHFLTILAPYAPHLSDHLWQEQGGAGSVHQAPWPERIEEEISEVTIGVQVNGKKRGEITLSPEASEAEAVLAARAIATVEGALFHRAPGRVVYVPGRILNLVADNTGEGV
jgi:leucyl-tRNA synthetase